MKTTNTLILFLVFLLSFDQSFARAGGVASGSGGHSSYRSSYSRHRAHSFSSKQPRPVKLSDNVFFTTLFMPERVLYEYLGVSMSSIDTHLPTLQQCSITRFILLVDTFLILFSFGYLIVYLMNYRQYLRFVFSLIVLVPTIIHVAQCYILGNVFSYISAYYLLSTLDLSLKITFMVYLLIQGLMYTYVGDSRVRYKQYLALIKTHRPADNIWNTWIRKAYIDMQKAFTTANIAVSESLLYPNLATAHNQAITHLLEQNKINVVDVVDIIEVRQHESLTSDTMAFSVVADVKDYYVNAEQQGHSASTLKLFNALIASFVDPVDATDATIKRVHDMIIIKRDHDGTWKISDIATSLIQDEMALFLS